MNRITNIRKTIVFAGFLNLICTPGMSQEQKHDTIRSSKVYEIGEVVVTGSRNETDVRHLSQTVSVINRIDIEHAMQPLYYLCLPNKFRDCLSPQEVSWDMGFLLVLPEVFRCVA